MAVAYLLFVWIVGVGLTLHLPIPWKIEGRVAFGLPLGVAAASMLTWLVSIPFGMSDVSVAVGASLLAVTLLPIGIRRTKLFRLGDEWSEWKRGWRSFEHVPLLLLVAIAGTFFIPFCTHVLKVLPDGLHAGYLSVWVDWSVHLDLATFFSTAQHLLPPENPMFARTNLPYPFLPDFFSGILLHITDNPIEALALPSALLSLAFVLVLYDTSRRFLHDRWAACLATLIFLVGAGFGFVLAIGDVSPDGPSVLGWLAGAMHILASPPREYTYAPADGIWWHAPMLAYLVTQRSVDLGWPLTLLALSLLWEGLRAASKQAILLAGVVVGLLPLFHPNSYIAVLVWVGGVMLLLGSLRPLLTGSRRLLLTRFFAPALILGLPQVWLILPPSQYRLPFDAFFRFQFGWMASEAGRNDNVIWFWLYNTAFLIPLALLATLIPGWAPGQLKKFLLPAWLLFLVANVAILQPGAWDNSKWLVWWAIPTSMLAGLAVMKLARRGRVFATIAGLVLAAQFTSAFLTLDRAWQEQINVPSLPLMNNDDLAVSRWFRTNTIPGAVILAGLPDGNPIVAPVVMLSGRATVLTDPGSLFNLGVRVDERQQDVVSMLGGEPGTDERLRQYGVSYVVIGPWERQISHANLGYYHQRYPIVYRSADGEYEVFKVA